MSLLDQTYEEHDTNLPNTSLWFFDGLRSDLCFQALLKKMNFPAQA